MRPWLAALLGGCLWLLPSTAVADGADASIVPAPDGNAWTLRAGGATLVVNAGPSVDFGVQRLTSPTGNHWIAAPQENTSVTINGKVLAFGSSAAGFAYESATVTRTGHQLRLDAVFLLQPAGLRATRHYAITDGSPTFEAWTTLQRTGRSAIRAGTLNAVTMTLPAGKVHWMTGLQGDNADAEHDSAFTLQSRQLAAGEHLNLAAAGRSSEKTVPWFAVDGAHDVFYAALMWSGAWSLTVDAANGSLVTSFGLASMNTLIDAQPIDGPHVLFGAVGGGIWKASAALQSYVMKGVRADRPLRPLVTYNTWFAYGTRIDEGQMRGEMLRAAALGTELFVIDAGWYAGAGTSGIFDFETGLGTWQPDPERFPNGLSPLSEYAHSLGMKFGLWVEPERVSLDTVGVPGLAQEPWLATKSGNYEGGHAAQLCLGGAAGRAWVTARLAALIDTVKPDYLKWDNNLWVNCDRSGHGHGSKDGNFAQVNGLYEVLASLRARYPDLLLENVSGGGARLDVAMLRFSDVAWMDDRTAPAVHVRHNIEGLSALFPPAYLLSFVTDTWQEPLNGSPDLSLYFRSRMQGVLGLCFKNNILTGDDQGAIAGQIETYKTVREIQARATGTMLGAQAKAANGPAWDVFQETTTDLRAALIWAVQSDPGVGTITIKPTGLTADTQYEVRSVDAGVLGTVSGAYLATTGISIASSPLTAAHLFVLTAR